jgi:hypothetical protein
MVSTLRASIWMVFNRFAARGSAGANADDGTSDVGQVFMAMTLEERCRSLAARSFRFAPSFRLE